MIKNNKKAFSIIEVLIWIFIFTLWLTGIYAIITSTLKINDFNKNYIIASNLAREQLELIRNIRDSNYSKFKPFNLKNPNWISYSNSDKFEFWKYYKIENDYSDFSTFPIKLSEITNFWEWMLELDWKMLNYNLCLNNKNLYTFDCTTSSNKKTDFYKYVKITEVKYEIWGITTTIQNAFLLTSKVLWYKRWYHEFEVKTIITDWKRL